MTKATIFIDYGGPLIQYDKQTELLTIDDLNPEVHIRWRISGREMFWLGLRMIRVAVLGRLP